MRVLGIETTCDETAAAVVVDGCRIASNVVLSQVPLHERFGGVVPDIASRAHVEAITRVIERALLEAGIEPRNRPPVDAIAVAHRPGLIGSLLVGVSAAKALALAWDVPLVGVDHIRSHVYAGFLRKSAPFALPDPAAVFPAVSLVISGGHTAIYRSRSWIDHEVLGSTQDDAVGEAFDKAAAILGLGYPGGPAISRVGERGDPRAVRFPRTLLDAESLDFSFSGIKTSVLYHVKGQDGSRSAPSRSEVDVADVAASFEEAVVDVLVEKLRRALRRERSRRVIVGGGVACNRRLRARLDELARRESCEVVCPPPELCTDNAAMVAGLGWQLLEAGRGADLTLEAEALAC